MLGGTCPAGSKQGAKVIECQINNGTSREKLVRKASLPKEAKARVEQNGSQRHLVDGKRHQLCMRYQTNQCTFPLCKYLHACAMPTSEGVACAQKHPAMQRRNTPH